MQKMRYRLALDLGSTSLGWALLRLNAQDEPCAVIKAGGGYSAMGENLQGKENWVPRWQQAEEKNAPCAVAVTACLRERAA